MPSKTFFISLLVLESIQWFFLFSATEWREKGIIICRALQGKSCFIPQGWFSACCKCIMPGNYQGNCLQFGGNKKWTIQKKRLFFSTVTGRLYGLNQNILCRKSLLTGRWCPACMTRCKICSPKVIISPLLRISKASVRGAPHLNFSSKLTEK